MSARRELITAEQLRAQLHYDPATGVFTRLVATGGRYRTAVGDAAGCLNDSGYVLISLNSLQYRAHRLAWLYMTGKWPEFEVDHRNGRRADNRWDNLRDASPGINQQNRRQATCRSTTGLLGVSFLRREGKFGARIWIEGKYRSLGQYDSKEKAYEVYLAAKRQHHAGCTI